MKYLSLCSGIEAASVAWHPLGWTPAAFAEIEPFPAAVLAHHWPSIPNLGDITKYASWPDIGSIDLLVGGTPCQAFSVAGLKRGLADARGNLALTFCEIADHYDPEWTLWENVPGVLSDRTNAFGCFLGRLCGADSAIVPGGGRWASAGVVSGPDRTVAWRVLDAQYFGVAQRRRRVFVLAVRGARNWRCAAALFPLCDGVRRDPAEGRKARKAIAGSLTKSLGRHCGVPDGADTAGQLISHCLRGTGFDASEDGTGRGTPLTVVSGQSRDVTNCLTRREAKGPDSDATTTLAFRHFTSPTDTGVPQVDIAPTLRKSDTSGQCVAFESRYFTRDNKTGGKPSETVQLSATGAAKAGDAAPCVAFDTTQITSPGNFSNPKPGDPCHPLASKAHAPCVAFSGRMRGDDGRGYDRPPNVTGDIAGTVDTVKPGNVAGPKIGVRRLTPRECERLQGFPDDYTRIPNRLMDALKIEADPDNEKHWAKDGPRYAALGNSMAVPVMSWIGRRIEFVKANF